MSAAPMDGLSLSDEASLSHLRQRLQRDLNCLSDPDRSTRKRALTKLQKALFREAKVPEAVLRGFLSRYLSERLVGMMADPVEKCREMAGGLLLEFVDAVGGDALPDTTALAKQVFSMAEVRIGSVPLVEPAEEVRALLLRLCGAVLRGKSAEIFGCEITGEACGVLSAALTDPFPEAKRECCSLLLRLADVCPEGLRSRLGKVLRPLILNLGHQHSKTRQMTLEALGALLLCGSDDLDKPLRELILPQLRNLLYDRTVAVRRELVAVLASLVAAGFLPPHGDGGGGDGNGYDTGGGHLADSAVAPMDTADDGDNSGGNNSNTTTTTGGGISDAAGAGAEEERRGACARTKKKKKYLEPHRAELLSLLMKLLADESEPVRGEAGRALEGLGEAWARSADNPSASTTEQQQRNCSPPVPPLPTGPGITPARKTHPSRPAAAAVRALCVSLLPSMMPAAIEEASHWTVRGRRRALWLLCFLVRYAGEEVTPYLPQLLASLGEASRDDEAEVRQAVDECAAAIGEAAIDLGAVTDILLPVLRGEVSGESNKHLIQALAVLTPVLSAAAATRPEVELAPHLGPVCAALCGRGLLDVDPSADGELWEAELSACRAAVGTGLGNELRRPRVRLDLLRGLLWLLAGSGAGAGDGVGGDPGAAAKEEVLEIASQLAAHQDSSSPSSSSRQEEGAQGLFARHFTDLLACVLGDAAVGETAGAAAGAGGGEGDAGWGKGSRRRGGFEALLRSAPRAVGEHLGEVMPIFRGLLHDATREPEVRLSMLALLECVVKHDGVTEESLRPHAETLLKEMVLPNAVWRAGLVAATVRKVAIAVLYTALRGNKIGVEAVYASAEQVLPVLKTNLEDHEATTRQMTCLSLEMMFRMIPGALGDEPVRLVYPELLKRLDDSNDTVRMAVCGAIAAFFRATPPQNVRGTVLQYMSEQLLVHLDDQDEAMQRAVFAVMEVAAAIDPKTVERLASEARSSHRTPSYCDRLVALCSSSSSSSRS